MEMPQESCGVEMWISARQRAQPHCTRDLDAPRRANINVNVEKTCESEYQRLTS